MDNKKQIFIFFIILIILPALISAVIVTNTNQLADAVLSANQGGDKEIIMANGTYNLEDMLWISGDGLIIRSQSGNRQDVTIRGKGMYGSVSHIFNVAGTNFTVRDMTIGWVSNHAIQIHGNNNSSSTLILNLRIVNTYEQMVKISYNPASSNSSKNGIMENCLLEYTDGIGPQYYIGGIDGHQTKNWIVRKNVFKNIISPEDDIAEHAIHFWSGSENTLVENNLIINCDRGIGFGLGDRGHKGGIIRNNMIVHFSSHTTFADVGIGLENAENAYVYNNTIFLYHDYPNAIEYRFPGTTGCYIANNLTNRIIAQRDSASANLARNITNAQAGWFVDASSGDLHLSYPVTAVVDKGINITGLTSDFDGDPRPQGKGIDIGADEYYEGESGPGSPLNFSAEKKGNRSLFFAEYLVVLSWQAPTEASDITVYRIYRVENNRLTLLTEVDATTFFYWHRGVERDITYRYAITAVSQSGLESPPVYATAE